MAQGAINTGKVVVIGGSAGSLDVLLRMLPGINPTIPYPIVIILHRKFSNESVLAGLLAARTKWKVKDIEDKDVLKGGAVYVAPGDYHLLFEKDGTLSLDFSEKVNFSRPSIDVGFQSAAEAFGSNLTCILLSGANSDGTEGFRQVRERGGITIAQSPETAEVSFMPEQAIAAGVADQVLDTEGIISYLNNL